MIQKTVLQTNENMRGGQGVVKLHHILRGDELRGHGRLFSEIVLEPGCSIGYHVHENEMECFYIADGEGFYDDNGTRASLKSGDVTITNPGEGHAVSCAGDKPLRIIALILQ